MLYRRSQMFKITSKSDCNSLSDYKGIHLIPIKILLRYIKPVRKPDALPDLQGSLSKNLHPAAITSASHLMLEVKERARTKKKTRGEFHKFSATVRARIGQYACENGIAAAARRFSHKLEKPVNKSTVRGIKSDYLAQVNLKRRARSLWISGVCQPESVDDLSSLEMISTTKCRSIS